MTDYKYFVNLMDEDGEEEETPAEETGTEMGGDAEEELPEEEGVEEI